MTYANDNREPPRTWRDSFYSFIIILALFAASLFYGIPR